MPQPALTPTATVLVRRRHPAGAAPEYLFCRRAAAGTPDRRARQIRRLRVRDRDWSGYSVLLFADRVPGGG